MSSGSVCSCGELSSNQRNCWASMKSNRSPEFSTAKISGRYSESHHRQLAENFPSKPQITSHDSSLIFFPLYEENFLLGAIDEIVKKRWRIIGNTTRYGWLAACYYKRTVSAEDARILSALGNKIGVENCTEAIERIEILAEKLHPREVPTAAIAVLTETDTALMLRYANRQEATERSESEFEVNEGPISYDLYDFRRIFGEAQQRRLVEPPLSLMAVEV